MAIRPTHFSNDDMIYLFHDEKNHGKTVPLSAVKFLPNRGAASENLFFIEVACPVPGCNSVSVHPASGGCDPAMVQELFARKLADHPEAKKAGGPKRLLRSLVEQQDGPQAWRLGDVESIEDVVKVPAIPPARGD